MQIPSPIELLNDPLFKEKEIELYLKRDDLIEPYVGGNKIRKMKYAFEHIIQSDINTVISCGGVYSNHIHALSYYSKYNNIQSIGLIRGDEGTVTPTLEDAKNQGMQIVYITREEYRKLRTHPEEIINKYIKDSNYYYLPEGGSSVFALKGCAEIIEENNYIEFQYICCPVGTGATIAGISSLPNLKSKVLGFPAIKNSEYIDDEIKNLLLPTGATTFPLLFHNKVCMDGYGKINEFLVVFIKEFYLKHNILLDPLYNGKMMYYIFELIKDDYFEKGSKILCIHTGGTQGWRGFPHVSFMH